MKRLEANDMLKSCDKCGGTLLEHHLIGINAPEFTQFNGEKLDEEIHKSYDALCIACLAGIREEMKANKGII